MKKITLLLFLMGILISPTLNAQWSIGDIAFIGYNSDDPGGSDPDDQFVFIALRSIKNGEQIGFTDRGWLAAGDFRTGGTNDKNILLTFNNDYPAGTKFSISKTANNAFLEDGTTNAGPITNPANGSSTQSLGLHTDGDQIFAYDPNNIPDATDDSGFIAAIHMNGEWDADATNNNDSAKPAIFTANPDTSVFFVVETDNARIKAGSVPGGTETASAIRTIIRMQVNWNKDDTTPFIPLTTGTFCVAPDVPTVTSSPVCNGNDATLTIDGDLRSAATWHVYTDSCGGTPVGTTTTGSIDVTPTAPSTTYYIRGEGGCVTPGTCASVIVNVTTVTAAINTSSNVSCNGADDGSATVTPAGGTAPYTYSWDNGGGSAASASGLAPNTYEVTVTDANGCTATDTVTITEPATLIAAAVIDNNPTCNGGADGAASASALGGDGSYTYSWDDPSNSTTASITGLAAGMYTVTITDGNGCSDTASVNIVAPSAVTAAAVIDNNVSCNGLTDGQATASALGGDGSFAYSWDDPANSDTATISGLAPGTYTVTVTDGNGCTDTASITITQPTVLTANISASANVSCNGADDGSATVTPAGGTAPYTYSWDNGGGSAASASGLAPNTYEVTVTDANGCTATDTVTITEPAALVAAAVIDNNPTCNGDSDGAASASALGGDGSYTYSWDDPSNSTTASITGLAAGMYTVTITDGNGCTDTASVTIVAPSAVTAAAIIDNNVSCNGLTDGQATASALGGDGSFAYSWDDPANSDTATISGLAPGTYTVTVTDGNGCTDTASITITEPAVEDASFNFDAASYAVNDTDPTPTITGEAGGTFSASPSGLIFVDNMTGEIDLSASTVGNYTITYTTAAPCSNTSDVNVEITASTLSNPNIAFNEKQIQAYPNPSSGMVYFSYNGTAILQSAEVYSIQGKRVLTQKISNNSTTVNLSTLAQGVYFIKLNADKGSVTKRVLKN